MKHNIAWFDVPALDLDRAIRFYSAVLGASVKKDTWDSIPLGLLPTPDGHHMGCIVCNANSRPSPDGVMLWFAVHGRLHAALAAVQPHGGTVQRDIHPIASYGFRAEVLDSEGNYIALFSETDQ